MFQRYMLRELIQHPFEIFSLVNSWEFRILSVFDDDFKMSKNHQIFLLALQNFLKDACHLFIKDLKLNFLRLIFIFIHVSANIAFDNTSQENRNMITDPLICCKKPILVFIHNLSENKVLSRFERNFAVRLVIFAKLIFQE